MASLTLVRLCASLGVAPNARCLTPLLLLRASEGEQISTFTGGMTDFTNACLVVGDYPEFACTGRGPSHEAARAKYSDISIWPAALSAVR